MKNEGKAEAPPHPDEVRRVKWWGMPNVIERIVIGYDQSLRSKILSSNHWKGYPADIDSILSARKFFLVPDSMRDAIDFVHASIHSTIKALKFSHFSHFCGGPIEIATITTDRNFRWVRHKSWDAAISEGER